MRDRPIHRSILDPDMLLRAYAMGVFPMADSRDAPDVFWVEPKRRGVMPLDRFHLSRSLAKVLKSERFVITADHAFADVVTACAAPTPARPDTWINRQIEEAYRVLYARAAAHSVEVWEEGQLVGGLYGVKLGGAFFGESMFSRTRDASKVALAHLVARLRLGRFALLDCQFITDHLASLGAIEIGRDVYVALLAGALAAGVEGSAGDFRALDLAEGAPALDDAGTVFGPTSGYRIVQLLGQTS